MDNPYRPPEPSPEGPDAGAEFTPPEQRSTWAVGHVRVVAILMIVQGALEILMGIGLCTIGVLFPWRMIQTGEADQLGSPDGPNINAMFWVMTIVFGGMGVVVLLVAGLHVFAGIRNFKFRGRSLGIVALAGGLVTAMACYCAPTAIMLAVYGLIVYLNTEVGRAFVMGEQGFTNQQIQETFY